MSRPDTFSSAILAECPKNVQNKNFKRFIKDIDINIAMVKGILY